MFTGICYFVHGLSYSADGKPFDKVTKSVKVYGWFDLNGKDMWHRGIKFTP